MGLFLTVRRDIAALKRGNRIRRYPRFSTMHKQKKLFEGFYTLLFN